jgi:hypothetical protein
MLGYAERDLDEPVCKGCEVPVSWCQCEPEIDRFPEEPRVVQSTDKVIGAIDTWLRGDEPWHLEPPTPDTKEEDYAHIVREMRDFIGRWGASALMRCCGEALKP